MNPKMKKIIAREGLILLGTVIIGIVLFVAGMNIQGDSSIVVLGFIIGFCSYPIYLLIRFILWAIKILREKS